MTLRRWILGGSITAVLAVISSQVAAGEPSLEVFLQPTKFGVEDLAQLTVRVNEPPSNLGAPAFEGLDNLEIVQGPSTGSEFSFVNGVASRSQTFTYVVRALEPGTATVASIVITAADAELRWGPLEVEVVEGSIVPPRRRPRSPFTDPFGDLRARRAPPRVEVVLRHSISARDVTVGQPLVATVYLDSTASSLYDFNWRTAPSYPGFWAQRLDNPERVMPEVVEIDGTAFYRYPVLRSVLVPLKEGSLEIPALEATIGVRSRGFFDTGQLIDRATPARLIEVAPRPAPPAGFAGAVGDLRYSASLEPAEIEFGESAVLTVTLKGRGNLPLVEAPPVLPSCEGCDVYPPEEESRVTVDESGIHGSRIWRVTVVPQSWGEVELGAVALAVFDPESRRFIEQTIGPLSLTVIPPPPTPTPIVTPVPVDEADTGAGLGRAPGEASGVPPWLWLGAALVLGLSMGALVTWFVTRRAGIAVPPRRKGQTPAERARILQLILERWWLDARSSRDSEELEQEMTELRRDLEAVRFAPGRADHSDTVVDLETRLKRLIRRA